MYSGQPGSVHVNVRNFSVNGSCLRVPNSTALILGCVVFSSFKADLMLPCTVIRLRLYLSVVSCINSSASGNGESYLMYNVFIFVSILQCCRTAA